MKLMGGNAGVLRVGAEKRNGGQPNLNHQLTEKSSQSDGKLQGMSDLEAFSFEISNMVVILHHFTI